MSVTTRRIITSKSGQKSSVASDEVLQESVSIPFGNIQDLWRIDNSPATPASGQSEGRSGITGSPGSALFRILEILPDSVVRAGLAAQRAKFGDEVHGASLRDEDFGMHESATVDFVSVLKGEVELHLDDGSMVELKQGDCVVQGGARHAWRNPGNEPATISAVVLTSDAASKGHWLEMDRFCGVGDTPETGCVRTRIPEDTPIKAPGAEGFEIKISKGFSSPRVRLVEEPHGMVQLNHTSPEAQLVAVLAGRLEVTTSDGSIKGWGAGECFIASDFGTVGHHTRITDGPVRLLFAAFEPGFDLDKWTV